MKVEKKDNNTYEIFNNEQFYTLSLSQGEDKLFISLEVEGKTVSSDDKVKYSSSYTKATLKNLSERYLEFAIEAVFNEMKSVIEKGMFRLDKDNDSLMRFSYKIETADVNCLLEKETKSQVQNNENNQPAVKNIFLLSVKLIKKKEDHTDFVSSLCITKDNRLASCSGDKTIKIFNLKTYECELTLEGHTCSVRYISLLSDGSLISSSWDTTIKIWSVSGKNFVCSHTIFGHESWVYKAIEISNNRIASCSKDQTIKLWNNFPPYDCVATLTGHKCWVVAIIELTNKKYIVSNGYDDTIRFWSSETTKCIKTLVIQDCRCYNNNSLIEIQRNRVMVGDFEKLSIINVDTFQLESVFEIRCSCGIYSLCSLGSYCVILGSNQGNLVQINTNECKIEGIKEKAHNGIIYGLLNLDDKTIISCSTDCSIKFWEQ